MNKIEKIEKGIKDLQKQLEKLKEKEPKLEVGKWYVSGSNLFYIMGHMATIWYKCYGFDGNGWLYDSKRCVGEGSPIPATDKEVEEALIKEAKKRGFKEGVRVSRNGFNVCSNTTVVNKTGDGFHLFDDEHLFFGSTQLFDGANGKWAEIIEDKLIIHGEEMKQEGDIISFGYAKFETIFFTELWEVLQPWQCAGRGNRKIISIKLSSGKEFTINDLKQIVEAIK